MTTETNKTIIRDKTEKEGVITFIQGTKGYGFIQDNEDESIFFHITDFLDIKEMVELKTGMKVTFMQAESQDGRTKAIGVKLAGEN